MEKSQIHVTPDGTISGLPLMGRLTNLRARTIDADGVMQRVAQEAMTSGLSVRVCHGGTVPNSYGYQARTEVLGIVAGVVDKTLYLRWRSSTIPANKVTLGGAASATLGEWARCGFDSRFRRKLSTEQQWRYLSGGGVVLPIAEGEE